jgi:2-oxoglutarate ferredoxin oxidoreductase subunit alpha
MGAPSSVLPRAKASAKPVEELQTVVIRFAGDSGDGMQLTGTQFTTESALAGNDIATLPDFPAEIRAPAGTLAGVSGFQLNFSNSKVFTPGDRPDVLVVMNPAALAVNLEDLRDGGILIVDTDAFTKANLRKAGYDGDPLEEEALSKRFRVFPIAITKMTQQTLAELDLPNKSVVRCKNFFALGLCSWLFNRPTDETLRWIDDKFSKAPALIEANKKAFQAGWNYGETTDAFSVSYSVAPAQIEPGRYTSITGNVAVAYGLMAAAAKADKQLVYCSYPITPASDVLHELSGHKDFGVVTFQAEDEIAAVGSALGASFGGAIGATASSGPGVSLKSETLGLAVMVELPLVVVNIQRGGPSTGLPTKPEQSDLLQALYGRHGECPLPVLAASSPTDCFDATFEAVRVALKYMTPVIMLSDGFLANGSKPWKVPSFDDLPEIPAKYWTKPVGFHPYLRDEDTLSRPWVVPGTPGLEHRIGGLEKDFDSGNISYLPLNHERMAKVRASKVQRVADDLDPQTVEGAQSGDVLVIGWGSTHGAIEEAVNRLQRDGLKIGHAHLRWLNPLPPGLGDVISRFERVIVPELNLGQLVRVIREHFLVDAVPINQVQGHPFSGHELADRIRSVVTEGRS